MKENKIIKPTHLECVQRTKAENDPNISLKILRATPMEYREDENEAKDTPSDIFKARLEGPWYT